MVHRERFPTVISHCLDRHPGSGHAQPVSTMRCRVMAYARMIECDGHYLTATCGVDWNARNRICCASTILLEKMPPPSSTCGAVENDVTLLTNMGIAIMITRAHLHFPKVVLGFETSPSFCQCHGTMHEALIRGIFVIFVNQVYDKGEYRRSGKQKPRYCSFMRAVESA